MLLRSPDIHKAVSKAEDMANSQQRSPTGNKPWVMNAFAMAAPGHLAPGLWKHPEQEPQTLEHWIQLAKKLDEAKFHGMSCAPSLGPSTD